VGHVADRPDDLPHPVQEGQVRRLLHPAVADRRYIEYPGYNGGSDWGGVAVWIRAGVIVANYNDMPNYNRLVPRAEADAKGWAPRGEARGGSMKKGAEGAGDPQVGTPYAIDVNAGWRLPLTGLLCKEPPYGGICAPST
jgi:quinoprotein glucose dehydrogenase